MRWNCGQKQERSTVYVDIDADCEDLYRVKAVVRLDQRKQNKQKWFISDDDCQGPSALEWRQGRVTHLAVLVEANRKQASHLFDALPDEP